MYCGKASRQWHNTWQLLMYLQTRAHKVMLACMSAHSRINYPQHSIHIHCCVWKSLPLVAASTSTSPKEGSSWFDSALCLAPAFYAFSSPFLFSGSYCIMVPSSGSAGSLSYISGTSSSPKEGSSCSDWSKFLASTFLAFSSPFLITVHIAYWFLLLVLLDRFLPVPTIQLLPAPQKKVHLAWINQNFWLQLFMLTLVLFCFQEYAFYPLGQKQSSLCCFCPFRPFFGVQ